MKTVDKLPKDPYGNILQEGTRVYTFTFEYDLVYGTLHRNPFTDVSEWAVLYDDGEDCAVLDFSQLFKASKQDEPTI